MATGANATPLGKLHPSIGAKRGFDAGPGAGNGLMPTPAPPGSFPSLQSYPGTMPSTAFSPAHQFSPGTGFSTQAPPQQGVISGMAKTDFGQKKRKKSRWSSETPDQKTVIPGMPTVIPPGLTRDQERAYIGKC
uniref:SF01 n=1 Tax=Poeciliopsis prolifica TaxID=188132 RepID=A0A0S7ELI1_9TELE